MPPPPPLFPLHALSPLSGRVYDDRGAEAAGVHGVLDHIFIGQQDADVAIAAHLAFAEHASILAVDL